VCTTTAALIRGEVGAVDDPAYPYSGCYRDDADELDAVAVEARVMPQAAAAPVCAALSQAQ